MQAMTDIEIGVLTLLAKAVFVLVTAACMVQFAQRIQLTRRRGWQVLVPLLIWLVWVLVTFLAAFAVLVLANAHTHAATATLSIRVIATSYPLLGGWLLVQLVRHIRSGGQTGGTE
jgi:hypothetical protein